MSFKIAKKKQIIRLKEKMDFMALEMLNRALRVKIASRSDTDPTGDPFTNLTLRVRRNPNDKLEELDKTFKKPANRKEEMLAFLILF